MKTLRQIADEFGVSKSTISRYISNIEGIDKLSQRQGNKALYDDTVSNLVREQMSKKVKVDVTDDDAIDAEIAVNASKNVANASEIQEIASQRNAIEAIIASYTAQIAAKDTQIKEMLNQIAELQTALENERQHSRETADKLILLADQAQKLQLAQMKPQLEAPKKRKSLFQRLIKRDD